MRGYLRCRRILAAAPVVGVHRLRPWCTPSRRRAARHRATAGWPGGRTRYAGAARPRPQATRSPPCAAGWDPGSTRPSCAVAGPALGGPLGEEAAAPAGRGRPEPAGEACDVAAPTDEVEPAIAHDVGEQEIPHPVGPEDVAAVAELEVALQLG